MITPTSFKIKVNGTPKTIDTVIDTDPTKDNIENSTKDLFEPRINNRFLISLIDQNNIELIPSYLIKKIQRPQSYTDEFESDTQYTQLVLGIYECTTLSVAKILENHMGKPANILLQVLGPIGDVIETWKFENIFLTSIQYSNLDWSDDNISYIQASFDCNKKKTSISVVV